MRYMCLYLLGGGTSGQGCMHTQVLGLPTCTSRHVVGVNQCKGRLCSQNNSKNETTLDIVRPCSFSRYCSYSADNSFEPNFTSVTELLSHVTSKSRSFRIIMLPDTCTPVHVFCMYVHVLAHLHTVHACI